MRSSIITSRSSCSLNFRKMTSRSVLVNYMERRKVFKIPNNANDVQYLTGEFKKEFSLELSEVTFQRFDEEWGLPVDLEPDKSIDDKDKLTAVVTPKLVSSCSSASSSGDYNKVLLFKYISKCQPVKFRDL